MRSYVRLPSEADTQVSRREKMDSRIFSFVDNLGVSRGYKDEIATLTSDDNRASCRVRQVSLACASKVGSFNQRDETWSTRDVCCQCYDPNQVVSLVQAVSPKVVTTTVYDYAAAAGERRRGLMVHVAYLP